MGQRSEMVVSKVWRMKSSERDESVPREKMKEKETRERDRVKIGCCFCQPSFVFTSIAL